VPTYPGGPPGNPGSIPVNPGNNPGYPNGNSGPAPYRGGTGGAAPDPSGGTGMPGRSTSFGNGANQAAPPSNNQFAPAGAADYRGTSNQTPANANATVPSAVQSPVQATLASAPASKPGDVITVPVSNGPVSAQSAPGQTTDTATATLASRQPIIRTLEPRPKDTPVVSGSTAGTVPPATNFTPGPIAPSTGVRDIKDLPPASSDGASAAPVPATQASEPPISIPGPPS